MKKTKIICTMGPGVTDRAKMRALMENGMDCARLNFSHGDHEEQLERIVYLKEVRKELGIPFPILLDTKGPEIRIRDFSCDKIFLEKGDTFTLTTGDVLGDQTKVSVTYEKLYEAVSVGTEILIDDGLIGLEVKEIVGSDIVCTVKSGGKLSRRKSINVPGVSIPMDYLSEKDKSDILFGIEQDLDFIAASFVRSAQDVRDVRNLLDANGGEKIKIISKIENAEGVSNLDEIIELSDGVMVARGDMGVEIPFKELPAIQKRMIQACYKAGKIVVTATQMLDSMQNNPRPTRAEVTDVANAIYDGTTVTMLSGETAAGDYPIEAVRAMREIADSTEADINYKKRFLAHSLECATEKDIPEAVAIAACNAADLIEAKAIIAVTRSGRTARMISKYHPSCPIIAEVVDEKEARQLNLAWGVKPVVVPAQDNYDDLFKQTIETAKNTGLVKEGDVVVMALGSSVKSGDKSDILRIHQI